MVAIDPLSVYRNGAGSGSRPAALAAMRRATNRAPWIAPWATPGTSGTAARSPMTVTSGCPGTARCSSTTTRPARSRGTPVRAASRAPSSLPRTPAAQTLAADGTRVVCPSAVRQVTESESTSVTIAFSTTSTPDRSSDRWVLRPRRGPNGGRTWSAPSIRMMRAAAGSMRRNCPRSVTRESSAIWPAISTPVGPAPTTTKVSSFCRSSGESATSAFSKAEKMRARSSRASSMVFMPGA